MKDNYINVQGWMVTKLKLSGNELLIFALIYGFSQDGSSEFKGSINYICNWLNCSRPTVSKILKDLTDKNFIEKRIFNENNVIFNRYKVNLLVVKKLYMGSKETLHGGSKETLHNNTIINNTKDNTNTTFDFSELLKFINKSFGREFRLINNSVKKSFNARLKDGYSKQDIKNCIENLAKNQYHKENGYQYCTPEFISRSSTLEKYSTKTIIKEENNNQQKMVW